MAATDYDFSLTLVELVEEAYRKIGILPDGETVSAAQFDTAKKKLNLIMQAMGSDGVQLFTWIEETLTLVAGTQSYAIPDSNGLVIADKVYVVDTEKDYSLERVTFHQWQDLLSKTDEGKPYVFMQSPSNLSLSFYPIPEQAYDVKILGIRKLKDWIDQDDPGEFPSRWLKALKYALAVELAEDYSMPITQVTYLGGIARSSYLEARGKESNRSDCRYMRGAY